MSLEPKSFLLNVDPGTAVATITLNRPERLNALTFEVYAELRDTFRALDERPDVRAIVLTGSGRGFCSGGDVEDIIGQLLGRDRQALLDFTRMTCDLVAAMRACHQPIVAALNGTVAGAGAVIAAACDVRLAVSSAKIAFLFTRVGLSGADMGIAWLLPRLIGLGRATELLMTGRFASAEEAERIGLYNRVVPDAELASAAQELALNLARGPAHGLARTKALLEQEAFMTFRDALALEAEAQAECMTHPDFAEAHQAFVEKRTPHFGGPE